MSLARNPAGALAILLLAQLQLGCSTVPKRAPDLDRVSIDKITVMPPTFTLQKVGAFSQESVSEMTHELEKEIKRSFERIVEASAYDVALLDTSDEALRDNSELRTKIFDQAQSMQDVYQSVGATKSKTIELTAEGDFDYFADAAHADYLLFVRGFGWWETTGSIVKGAVLAGLLGGGSGPSRAFSFDALLLDANTNRVLWYNSAPANEDPRKPSELFKAAKELMKPLLGDVAIEPEKDRDEAMKARFEAFEEEVKAGAG